MVNPVERMLDLHQKLVVANTPDDKTRLRHESKATDRQIDEIVYGLTEEEIKIAEEATGR